MKLCELMKIMTCTMTVVNLTNPENDDLTLTFWNNNESFLIPISYDAFSKIKNYTVTEITKNSSNDVIVFIKDI